MRCTEGLKLASQYWEIAKLYLELQMKILTEQPTPREANPLFDRPVKGLGVSVEGGSCPEPRVPTKIGTGVPLTAEQVAQAERIKNNQFPKVTP
jgi:hypothetical protein